MGDFAYVSFKYITRRSVKTYAWITATATSKVDSNINPNERWLIKIVEEEARAIKIWPAVILAARRIDSVIGRISCLIVSIKTINWDRANGVLRGTKWLRKLFVLFLKVKKNKPSQKGIAILNLKNMWEVVEKI